MKPTKPTKTERRARRKAKDDRRRGHGISIRPLGGSMDRELVERLRAAVQHLDLRAPWVEIAPMVLPVLKRVHHPYPIDIAPMHIQVPPGIRTGFGIDFGPAFSHVSESMLEHWRVDPATVLGVALENLRRLIVQEPPQVQRFEFEGSELVGVQGQGWGSSLVLLPDVLGPILGPAPQLLLTPIRNTLIALPPDVETDLAIDVWDAFASGAHDELDADPLRWTGSTVAAVGDGSLGLPN